MMRAPANTVIALAPIATQYGGSRVHRPQVVQHRPRGDEGACRHVQEDAHRPGEHRHHGELVSQRDEHRLDCRGGHGDGLARDDPDEPRPVGGRDDRTLLAAQNRRPRDDVSQHQPGQAGEAALEDVTHTGPAIFELAGDDPSGGEEGVPDVVRVPVVVVPGAQGYVPYQVVKGDTLSKIVRDNAWSDVATVKNIVSANGLPDPDKIRVRQLLRIPV